ncbi:hypothetical protein K438DRAFT_1780134 [Mycena galopus ATCC 62051]|nr:hypothetical protein K438DRAFT_1780134 [Mycena galopus ATCC 62051]
MNAPTVIYCSSDDRLQDSVEIASLSNLEDYWQAQWRVGVGAVGKVMEDRWTCTPREQRLGTAPHGVGSVAGGWAALSQRLSQQVLHFSAAPASIRRHLYAWDPISSKKQRLMSGYNQESRWKENSKAATRLDISHSSINNTELMTRFEATLWGCEWKTAGSGRYFARTDGVAGAFCWVKARRRDFGAACLDFASDREWKKILDRIELTREVPRGEVLLDMPDEIPDGVWEDALKTSGAQPSTRLTSKTGRIWYNENQVQQACICARKFEGLGDSDWSVFRFSTPEIDWTSTWPDLERERSKSSGRVSLEEALQILPKGSKERAAKERNESGDQVLGQEEAQRSPESGMIHSRLPSRAADQRKKAVWAQRSNTEDKFDERQGLLKWMLDAGRCGLVVTANCEAVFVQMRKYDALIWIDPPFLVRSHSSSFCRKAGNKL